MKSKYNLAVKFFTETKNDEQLALTYKEFESFHKSYENFKFFYKFKLNELDPKIKNQLTPEEQKLLDEGDLGRYIDEYKYKVCENVFSEGNYNIEFYQISESPAKVSLRIVDSTNSYNIYNTYSVDIDATQINVVNELSAILDGYK